MTPFILSRFILLKIIQFVKPDTVFHILFNNLFSSIPFLIRNLGMIPVSIGLWHLYKFLKLGLKVKEFPVLVLNKLNPIFVKTITDNIFPYWDLCLKTNTPLFTNLFRLFLGFLSLGFFRPIIFNIFKYSIGLFTASIGIAFNEALSSIRFLKWISDYILSFSPINFNEWFTAIKKPSVDGLPNSINPRVSARMKETALSNNPMTPNVAPNVENVTINDTGSFLSTIGFIIMGFGVVIAVILTGDYIAPSTIRWIPGMEMILDHLYSTGNYILSWFKSTPTPKPDVPPMDESTRWLPTPWGDKDIDLPSAPEVISRNSSDSTVHPLTPKPTRPGTPTPLEFPLPKDTTNWD
jgi:hypothetical protein